MKSYTEVKEQSDKIRGWLFGIEPQALYDEGRKAKTIVEIGSYEGLSSIFLGAGGNSLLCVDTFESDNVDPEIEKRSTLEIFKNNIKDFPNISYLQSDSVEAGKNYKGPKIDLLFLDGGHSKEQVKADFEAWQPHLKSTSRILFHDAFDNQGVGRNPKHTGVYDYLDELLKTGYQLIDNYNSIAVITK